MLLLAASFLSLLAVGYCGNFTVTDEAWFDIEIKDLDGPGEDYRGRVTIGLFGEIAPITVLNFKSLTRGYKRGRNKLSYKGTHFHRVVPDFVVQGGDITKGDGTGGRSIYGEKFNDEDFTLSHRSEAWVAMANNGKDSNNSQFYIMLTKARWLDGKHVVFGKVIRGYSVIDAMGNVPTTDDAFPKKKIRIIECGMNALDKRYDLTEDQLDSTEDL